MNQLLSPLRSLPSVYCIFQDQRTRSLNIYNQLRTLDIIVHNVTTDLINNSEQKKTSIWVKRAVICTNHQYLELRILGVFLLHYPNLRKVYKTQIEGHMLRDVNRKFRRWAIRVSDSELRSFFFFLFLWFSTQMSKNKPNTRNYYCTTCSGVL